MPIVDRGMRELQAGATPEQVLARTSTMAWLVGQGFSTVQAIRLVEEEARWFNGQYWDPEYGDAPTSVMPFEQGVYGKGQRWNRQSSRDQEPVAQGPVTQAPVAQGPVTQGPVAQATVVQAPTGQGPYTKAPAATAPTATAPFAGQGPFGPAPFGVPALGNPPFVMGPIGNYFKGGPTAPFAVQNPIAAPVPTPFPAPFPAPFPLPYMRGCCCDGACGCC